ncbi:hypothetical protein GCM10017044_20130 [Kordiimonas sediminis]|uniref:DUF192 domain-containing protein n=1 Tax=Kordiimonas sediminis TaxID=1735581 RepID=A0A919AVD0_9PROT|nr:DUF192 domain-containing protein [Kordiimonas sediminis]GHF25324.1 hypothetical protein GCM10017044_20130 [Kordiimonas sediminis]
MSDYLKVLIFSLFMLLSTTANGADYSEPLVINKQDGSQVELLVELAKTPEETARGMMFRTELGDNQGMLFLFAESRRQRFWMKNTLIPLDIIFIRENGRIANIVANAEPETETPRESVGRAIAVLELAGGRAAALGLSKGDHVDHPLIGKLPRLSY